MKNIHSELKIIPWNDVWMKAFEEERKRILDVVEEAGLVGEVYHIGSTSVKGMVSKPIIDILLCPEIGYDIKKFLPVLERINYKNLGECGREGRFFLSKGDIENRSFYLHLCYDNNQVALDQQLFQYIERNSKDIFHSYVGLKKALITLYPMDRIMYRTIKGMFIDSVLSAYRLGRDNDNNPAY